MLKVIPIQDKNFQMELCLKCGDKYDVNALAYAAYTDDTFAGVAQFRISKGYVNIISFSNAPDNASNEAMLIMGRTLVSFAYNFGCNTAYLDPSIQIDERLARVIGFSKNENGIYSMDVKKYVETPCEGCK